MFNVGVVVAARFVYILRQVIKATGVCKLMSYAVMYIIRSVVKYLNTQVFKLSSLVFENGIEIMSKIWVFK